MRFHHAFALLLAIQISPSYAVWSTITKTIAELSTKVGKVVQKHVTEAQTKIANHKQKVQKFKTVLNQTRVNIAKHIAEEAQEARNLIIKDQNLTFKNILARTNFVKSTTEDVKFVLDNFAHLLTNFNTHKKMTWELAYQFNWSRISKVANCQAIRAEFRRYFYKDIYQNLVKQMFSPANYARNKVNIRHDFFRGQWYRDTVVDQRIARMLLRRANIHTSGAEVTLQFYLSLGNRLAQLAVGRAADLWRKGILTVFLKGVAMVLRKNADTDTAQDIKDKGVLRFIFEKMLPQVAAKYYKIVELTKALKAKMAEGTGENIDSADWDNMISKEELKELLEMVPVQEMKDCSQSAFKTGIKLLNFMYEGIREQLQAIAESIKFKQQFSDVYYGGSYVEGDIFDPSMCNGVFLEAMETMGVIEDGFVIDAGNDTRRRLASRPGYGQSMERLVKEEHRCTCAM